MRLIFTAVFLVGSWAAIVGAATSTSDWFTAGYSGSGPSSNLLTSAGGVFPGPP
jgi:hypothetical protein